MTDPAANPWTIERLDRRHDRAGFDCGKAPLTEFLRDFAQSNQKLHLSQTYVAVLPGQSRIDGYYTIAPGSVQFITISQALRNAIPRYPVPVAHLGRLAVDATMRGSGLGELLLMDALRRIARLAEMIDLYAVEVWAIDDDAKRFYMKYSFVELADNALHLFFPVRVLRKLGFAS